VKKFTIRITETITREVSYPSVSGKHDDALKATKEYAMLVVSQTKDLKGYRVQAEIIDEQDIKYDPETAIKHPLEKRKIRPNEIIA